MENNNLALNRVFIQSTFKELLTEPSETCPYYTVIRRIINNPADKSNGQILSEIYSFISKNHRNEYYYKNTLLNKLLLGVHKPTTTVALTEIPIAKSKADFILINGKAVVYEIKTALDTFERLETQLKDYYKAFDHVAVLTDVKNQVAIASRLKDLPVGIYLMTQRGQLRCLKKPEKFVDYLDSREIFKVLNKTEYEAIIRKLYGKLPDVPPVKYYRECMNWFCNADLSISYPEFLKQLKLRNKIVYEDYLSVPYELKALIYFSHYRKPDYEELNDFLSKHYAG